LGEFSALYFAGGLSLEDTARLVSKRGQFMRDTIKGNSSAYAMVAVMPLSVARALEVCKALDLAPGKVCDVANANSANQVSFNLTSPFTCHK